MKKKVLVLLFVSLVLMFNFSYVTAADYNNYENATVSCGSGMLTAIPTGIPKVVSVVYRVIQIGVPIVLVVMGMLDLAKGIINAKEDEIKKNRNLFVKRLISAALIFFVFAVVKFLISLIADSSDDKIKILDCAECFISNNDKCVEEVK